MSGTETAASLLCSLRMICSWADEKGRLSYRRCCDPGTDRTVTEADYFVEFIEKVRIAALFWTAV